MTASSFASDNKFLSERLSVLGRLEVITLSNFGVAAVLALPLALLWTHGVLLVVGVVYCTVYTGAMLLPTALYVLVGFDAIRVLMRRRPAFMPFLVAMAKRAKKDGVQPKPGVITTALTLATNGNPLAALTLELWVLTARFNGKAIAELDAASNRIMQQLELTGVASKVVEIGLRGFPERAEELQLVAC